MSSSKTSATRAGIKPDAHHLPASSSPSRWSGSHNSHWLADAPEIRRLRREVLNHPLMTSVLSIGQLREFMQLHVYAVWDFMSLLKGLQGCLAPASWPWMPPENPLCARLINEIVLAEETDEAAPGMFEPFPSHFRLYLRAMTEIRADTRAVEQFLTAVRSVGWESALAKGKVPEPARRFMSATLELLTREPAHCWAAVFVVGREDLVPQMFARLQSTLGLSPDRASAFHHYLRRHIQLDGDTHGPMARALADALCGKDPGRRAHAVTTAAAALRARLELWDGIGERTASLRLRGDAPASRRRQSKRVGTTPAL